MLQIVIFASVEYFLVNSFCNLTLPIYLNLTFFDSFNVFLAVFNKIKLFPEYIRIFFNIFRSLVCKTRSYSSVVISTKRLALPDKQEEVFLAPVRKSRGK